MTKKFNQVRPRCHVTSQRQGFLYLHTPNPYRLYFPSHKLQRHKQSALETIYNNTIRANTCACMYVEYYKVWRQHYRGEEVV